MKREFIGIAAVVAVTAGVSRTEAASLTATSYDTINGDAVTWEYFDDTYDGIGDTLTPGAPLSGGTGDLTDGVIATDNWIVTEPPAGPGPYVGWRFVDPEISFHFGGDFSFDSMTFYFDDSDIGGVDAPDRVIVSDGVMNLFDGAVVDPAGTAPFAFKIDLEGVELDAIFVSITSGAEFIMLSEVTFEGSAVAQAGGPGAGATSIPEPSTLATLGLGLAGLAWMRRRRAA